MASMIDRNYGKYGSALGNENVLKFGNNDEAMKRRNRRWKKKGQGSGKLGKQVSEAFIDF